MKRIVSIFVVLCLGFLLATGRFYSIMTDETYLAGKSQAKKTVTIGSVRGTIFDTRGVRLTNTSYEYYAVAIPQAKSVNALKDYFDKNDQKTLASGFPVAVKVNENFLNDNVLTTKIPKRYCSSASHIIGYCDQNGEGICGIEQSYNDILKGDTVTATFTTNAKGEYICNSGVLKEKQEADGKGVMLTIDKSIQSICEAAAQDNMQSGSIVVIENNSGKIRAMVSFPSYDQNDISSALDSPSSPFFNRSLAAYNCGSVFKLLVAAAALYYDIDISINCDGNMRVGDTDFNCISAHSKVDMEKAITVSCNCYFIKLGQKIGAKRLLSFAKSFGFGNEITLCDSMKSTSATMPKLSDLLTKPAELANFSFGQGEILTSPLQIALLVQCISNDGKLIKPTLVEGVTDSNGKLLTKQKKTLPTYLLDEKDADTLCEYMVSAVENGTGKSAKPEQNGAGGKTATAQTGIFDSDGNAVYQTWFAGFYPAKDPVYTIVVLCENGSSGALSAAPVFKQIADSISGICN